MFHESTGPADAPAGDAAAEFPSLHPLLERALVQRGFTRLTSVQEQVLAASVGEADLRISSQTGSGKTLAIGFALRPIVETHRSGAKSSKVRNAAPAALVVVPTRELAKQVQEELAWLYAATGARVASVAGGGSYRDEHRSLAANPAVIVATPGRLLDHLKRGSVSTEGVGAVVLDEADQMLDLGFKDELDQILEQLPEERRTHLVSATFPRDVLALANRVQRNPTHVQGTPLGSANADIEHTIHLIEPRERVAALVNVLLHHPDDQTLVFARTRADVAALSAELLAAGFAAGALSGEMSQEARNQALAAFKRGTLRALVATDVAARGIDVQNIARVVQVDAPSNADTYTHRSGRTGRAGRKGKSVLLIPRAALGRVERILNGARVRPRLEPVPTREIVERAQDERWLRELVASTGEVASARVQQLAERIVLAGHTEAALQVLLTRLLARTGAPRAVTPVAPPLQQRGSRGNTVGKRDAPGAQRGARSDSPRVQRGAQRGGRDDFESDRPPLRDRGSRASGEWVSFQVSWGHEHGADARRLLAMLCRRGNVRGSDIGAIRISERSSEVEVAREVADSFAKAALPKDPRNPRVRVRPFLPPSFPAHKAESPRAGRRSAEHETPRPRGRRSDGETPRERS